jgi:hypothetical protein
MDRFRAHALWVGSVLITCALGCGGSVAVSGDGGPTATSSDGGGDAASDAPTRVPDEHRPSATACPLPKPQPEPTIPDAGVSPVATFECHKNEDCTAGKRGVCVFGYADIPISPGGTRCVYDECESDGDCGASGICTCSDVANGCTPSNCRVDADCGPGGFCSPTKDGCGTPGVGWYCHRPSDPCFTDAECMSPGQACVFDATSSAWACRFVGCASAGGAAAH